VMLATVPAVQRHWPSMHWQILHRHLAALAASSKPNNGHLSLLLFVASPVCILALALLAHSLNALIIRAPRLFALVAKCFARFADSYFKAVPTCTVTVPAHVMPPLRGNTPAVYQ